MPTLIPESHRDLLDVPICVVVSTTMRSGRPQSTVVWCATDGEQVFISVSDQSQKYRNLQRDPRLSLMAVDPTNPFRWIEIRGTVVAFDEAEGLPLLDALSQVYMAMPQYYGYVEPEAKRGTVQFVRLTIRPDKVKVVGKKQ